MKRPGWLARFRQSMKDLKEQKRVETVAQILSENPMTVELIKQICREYGYHWEFVQKDGSRMLFMKEGVEPAASSDSWRDW